MSFQDFFDKTAGAASPTDGNLSPGSIAPGLKSINDAFKSSATSSATAGNIYSGPVTLGGASIAGIKSSGGASTYLILAGFGIIIALIWFKR